MIDDIAWKMVDGLHFVRYLPSVFISRIVEATSKWDVYPFPLGDNKIIDETIKNHIERNHMSRKEVQVTNPLFDIDIEKYCPSPEIPQYIDANRIDRSVEYKMKDNLLILTFNNLEEDDRMLIAPSEGDNVESAQFQTSQPMRRKQNYVPTRNIPDDTPKSGTLRIFVDGHSDARIRYNGFSKNFFRKCKGVPECITSSPFFYTYFDDKITNSPIVKKVKIPFTSDKDILIRIRSLQGTFEEKFSIKNGVLVKYAVLQY